MIDSRRTSHRIIEQVKNQKSEFWEKVKVSQSLGLFKFASKNVPAYKDFLKKENINPELIKGWKDFQKLPPVNKKNYLRKYQLQNISVEGTFRKPLIFTSTSGSTGESFCFSR
jgi:phenylacetate-coenzyme A ligase PaaK-like adenylate-forming protein